MLFLSIFFFYFIFGQTNNEWGSIYMLKQFLCDKNRFHLIHKWLSQINFHFSFFLLFKMFSMALQCNIVFLIVKYKLMQCSVNRENAAIRFFKNRKRKKKLFLLCVCVCVYGTSHERLQFIALLCKLQKLFVCKFSSTAITILNDQHKEIKWKNGKVQKRIKRKGEING